MDTRPVLRRDYGRPFLSLPRPAAGVCSIIASGLGLSQPAFLYPVVQYKRPDIPKLCRRLLADWQEVLLL